MNRPTSRPGGQRALGNDARTAFKRATRAREAAEKAAVDLRESTEELERIHIKLEARFGRSMPKDALLLDLLGLVDVEGDDVWRWRGMKNNMDLASVRVSRGEKSVVRLLAVAFGVIEDSDNGMMFPADGDRDDVNPFHRVLRKSANPMGNTWRWGGE